MLIDNEIDNREELFVSILANFNMGKRLNSIQRDGFSDRATLTGLTYNQEPLWHQTSWKKYFDRSPGKNLKFYMKSKETSKETSKRKHIQVSRSKPKVSRKLNFTQKNDYGPNIAEIEL
ncbi:hypothetical protein WA026_004275 [Henosepilachna vigintioctopunctata]|uniref:Uncharacterized protein n=1 Tax=Henosepilachna vigintioctopunctata TaxID=420089 RepID=A0AAW1V9U0_9CUCU